MIAGAGLVGGLLVADAIDDVYDAGESVANSVQLSEYRPYLAGDYGGGDYGGGDFGDFGGGDF